jgi:hypothetical protein
MKTPSQFTLLDRDASIAFTREFHVEILRGGMNRLLLRAVPTRMTPTRVEVLFQYVQFMHMPLRFDELEIQDVSSTSKSNNEVAEILERFSGLRLFSLMTKGKNRGYVVSSECAYGADTQPADAESMFPMMS